MFSEDDEILQDFLVEAGEILEQLSEELVALEQNPDDTELLNTIFRGFHTIKGGAGFLQLGSMVECCHITENIFDDLRNRKSSVTPALMDVVLQALDTVNDMFAQVQAKEPLSPASPELLTHLAALIVTEETIDETPSPVPEKPLSANTPEVGGVDACNVEFEAFLNAVDEPTVADPMKGQTTETVASAASKGEGISEDEFETLLDEIHGAGKHGDVPVDYNSPDSSSAGGFQTGEITEEEFESLLDELHGDKTPGSGAAAVTTTSTAEQTPSAQVGKNTDLITDDDFDALLDQLHGQGKGPTSENTPAVGEGHVVAKVNPVSEVKPAVKDQSASKSATLTSQSASNPSAKKNQIKQEDSSSTKPVADKNAISVIDSTIRVDTSHLDDIMNMIGELVLVRNRFTRLGLNSKDEAMTKAVSNLDVVTADLQAAVMQTRMQPIKKVFSRFPRVVRDMARNLHKDVVLELRGEETGLDKNLVEALADPLVHLVRNSVDHGIEIPEVREAKGKSKTGKITLSAEQEGDHILLSITDDGSGMEPTVLRNIAVKRGLFDEESAARLSDEECFSLIFMPGFSTKSEVSSMSGRGVGMDVVKTNITQLNGSVDIHSKLNEGTRIDIKVPLTLAIMPTLMVMVGKQVFAFPLISVSEIFNLDLNSINKVDGQEVILVREKAIPLFHLRQWLVKEEGLAEPAENAHVVLVDVGVQCVGFVVDGLIGQEEVVIKPLGKMLQGTPGLAGATVTGEGSIALILDVPSLLKRYAG